ncbi:MAG: sigma-54-dependent Fis family transcriptional regulator [Xanthomonadaceae bacterium]|jgi:two-component system response regulator PilR (NtrC family)|nr:sigma-54-dependent Fis family transcriptional regulator [Xanthomonadaceae bacterium]
MLSRSALIVDDERDIRELVGIALSRMGLRVETAADLASARAQLALHDFDLCITDMRLPDGNGLALVEHIAAAHPRTAVAMMTAYGNVEAAVAALKAGAFDFVTKPVDLAVLRQLVTHALNQQVQRRAAEAAVPRLVGGSAAACALRERIAKVARSHAPVFIGGEPGSGKALVARLVHAASPRREGPFVAVDCAALPPDRIEAELFGQRAGPGVAAEADGLFQAAQGGSLFLDAVAELPAPVQAKLQQALERQAVRPLGGDGEVPIDVRLLSASHHDLARRVEEGRFRHDLYYRLHVLDVAVPPLRERREDLPALVEAALARRGGEPPRLADDALAALHDYPFPGNVRELESLLERAVALAEGPLIHAADLDLPAPGHGPLPGRREAEPGETAEADAPLPAMATAMARARAAGALPQALEQVEREAILRALEAHRWNRTRTAAALGITFRALRYKLKKLGIE